MTEDPSLPETQRGTRPYTRSERIVDAVVHVTGLAAALVAVPVMITLAAVWHGDVSTVTAATIYGVSFVAMFAASAGYHMVPFPTWKGALRRLDHAAIYVKIAGTYTPFAVLLAGPDAVWILSGIWAAALVGSALKIAAPDRFEMAALALYLLMGWAVLAIGGPIVEKASPASMVLIVIGGLLYTVGVIFHLWNRLPFQNAIWHLFVLAASFVFYAAVLLEVARGGA